MFPDMIARSVPGYALVIEMLTVFAKRFLKPNDVCYDLGCSLGECTEAILKGISSTPLRLIGVDSSPPMIARCRDRFSDSRVRFDIADVCDVEFEPAKFIVMHLLLQFIEPHKRGSLLQAIRESLRYGGTLLLTEKVSTDADFEEFHLDFKRVKGYSELEISQKRQALENVMTLDSIDKHIDRLTRAGFREIRVWFQCLNWVSILAS